MRMRQPLIVGAAFVINLVLFILIHQLVTNDVGSLPQFEDLRWVDYIRYVPEETPPERKKPLEPEELPPPEEAPPMPEMVQPDVPKPQQMQMKMETPNIDVPMSIGGVPYVGDYMKSSTGSAIGPVAPVLQEIATNVMPTTRVEPVYPPRALRAGIEGSVTVEFTIDTSGAVKDIEVVNADPPGVFEQAVMQAIRRWKFAPEMVDGKPVEKRARQDIKFSLKR